MCCPGVACTETPISHTVTSDASLMAGLLDSFGDVFAEPSRLPPPRSRDHSIVLKPGAAPVAVRPYRFPAAHKDELER